ncbi:MAG TPA: DUF4337 domain-containing protein [Opitutaceae bacterium]|nr:DUF4337 domain-containing protein [Opitutaceae bacterium]
MEEPEVPLEQAQEDIHHHATHAKARWTLGVALSSALLAGLAAICSLLAGHHANEAMIDQIKSSDEWNYYQAKGIKAAVLSAKVELLEAAGKAGNHADAVKAAGYESEQKDISEKAKELEKSSESHLHSHVVFARGVTLFQVAIAVAAISVLTNRRRFWLLSLVFGAVGVFFLLQGLLAP